MLRLVSQVARGQSIHNLHSTVRVALEEQTFTWLASLFGRGGLSYATGRYADIYHCYSQKVCVVISKCLYLQLRMVISLITNVMNCTFETLKFVVSYCPSQDFFVNDKCGTSVRLLSSYK